MLHHDPGSTKQRVLTALRGVARAPLDRLHDVAAAAFSADASLICSHPTNQLRGLAEIVERFWGPLKHAMPDLSRRDDILMCGHYKDHDWVSATGYYNGTFVAEWHGLRPSGHWLSVRFGEFYKVVSGTIVDAYVILDMIDVLRQLGVNPLPPGRGVEGYCPGPLQQDGLVLETQATDISKSSLALVESMIYDGLQAFDQVNHESIGMERFWTPDMMWYGPGGIGTTRGLNGFLQLHQYPWQEAFRDYVGGNHVARVADGLFVASTGWPSINATHTGSNLFGMDRTGRKVTMRVMDWWRRENTLLDENWIFIDIPDLLMQLGRDVLAEARALQSRS